MPANTVGSRNRSDARPPHETRASSLSTQPVAKSALARLRKVASVAINPELKPHPAAARADRRNTPLRYSVLPAARPNRRRRHRRQSGLAPRSPRNRSRLRTSTWTNATGQRIPVTAVPARTTEATADLAFGLMLAAARRLVEGDRQARAGKFPGAQSEHLMGRLVHGKTLGTSRSAATAMIGIGQGCAATHGNCASAYRVMVVAPYPLKAKAKERRAGSHLREPFDPELLRESDFEIRSSAAQRRQSRHPIGGELA